MGRFIPFKDTVGRLGKIIPFKATLAKPLSNAIKLIKKRDPLQKLVDIFGKELQAETTRTSTSILDSIAMCYNPDEEIRSKYSLDIDICEGMPTALIRDNLIYYDATEKCLMAHNLQKSAGRKIELYLCEDINIKSGSSTSVVSPKSNGNVNSLEAKNVEFISSYGKWIIISSKIE